MIAMELTKAFHKAQKATWDYNRMKLTLTPDMVAPRHFKVGTFTYGRGDKIETGPVFIDRRYVPRSKYAPGVPTQVTP
jgi:hypothetical protein